MIEGEPPHNKSDYRCKNDKHIDRRCDECKGERRKVFRLLVVISCECIRPIEGQHLHIYHITIKDIRRNNHRQLNYVENCYEREEYKKHEETDDIVCVEGARASARALIKPVFCWVSCQPIPCLISINDVDSDKLPQIVYATCKITTICQEEHQ